MSIFFYLKLNDVNTTLWLTIISPFRFWTILQVQFTFLSLVIARIKNNINVIVFSGAFLIYDSNFSPTFYLLLLRWSLATHDIKNTYSFRQKKNNISFDNISKTNTASYRVSYNLFLPWSQRHLVPIWNKLHKSQG